MPRELIDTGSDKRYVRRTTKAASRSPTMLVSSAQDQTDSKISPSAVRGMANR